MPARGLGTTEIVNSGVSFCPQLSVFLCRVLCNFENPHTITAESEMGPVPGFNSPLFIAATINIRGSMYSQKSCIFRGFVKWQKYPWLYAKLLQNQKKWILLHAYLILILNKLFLTWENNYSSFKTLTEHNFKLWNDFVFCS